ncbi:MAG TPA: inorganic pyrophosphatase [Chitinophagaceae bacterium]|nr:inorganic pyrophosphatase [Chitinophagaceae bacterium]
MERYPKNTLHPWHGVSAGDNAPDIVTTYIEIVPGDTVKYEIDKPSGLLKIDRPQKFSNICPTPYGFIPQTYCGERVAAYCMKKTGIADMQGDGDPLDICILTEKIIPHGNILLQAIPIGGLRMIDHNEADDKIIAVMKDDAVYGGYKDIQDCPPQLIERLKHYFLTYKLKPGEPAGQVSITHVYNCEEAAEVIKASREDYAILVA